MRIEHGIPNITTINRLIITIASNPSSAPSAKKMIIALINVENNALDNLIRR